MAFNPFHRFRKNQKAIFAVLTIICMFTFVLAGSFGKGDFFEWFLSLFGASGRQGKVVTTLYGDKVYEGQISDRNRVRQTANDFVGRAIGSGFTTTGQDLLSQVSKPAPADMANVELLIFNNECRTILFEMIAQDSLAREGYRVPPRMVPLTEESKKLLQDRDLRMAAENVLDELRNVPKRLEELRRRLGSLQSQIRRLKDKGMETEAKVLDAAAAMTSYDIWRLSAGEGKLDTRNILILGGTTKRQDTLDFMMWLKQADAMGIKFTDADIRSVVNGLSPARSVLTGKKSEDQKTLETLFPGQESNYIDLKMVYRGLGDEFRVALAQAIILGEAPGILALRQTAFRDPFAVTPLEYVDYYREQRQSENVVLLPVPVRSFATPDLPQPSERQIEDLYENYKSDEARPDSMLPGFKVPQRVRLQWISTEKLPQETAKKAAEIIPLAGFLRNYEDQRQDYYEDRAEAFFAKQIASSAASKIPMGYLAAADAFSSAYSSVLDESRVEGERYFRMPTLLGGDPALSLHTAMNLRTVIASTVGHAAAGTVLPRLPLAADVLFASQGAAVIRGKQYQEEVIKEERTKRARMIAGLVGSSYAPALSHSAGTTTLANWFWADSHTDPVYDTSVPMRALKFQVLKNALASKAKQQEMLDLGELFKNLDDIKGEPEAARKIVEEAIRKMHLENSTGESKFEEDNRYTLAKDPGLKPLVTVAREGRERGSKVLGDTFENEVFTPGGVYIPRVADSRMPMQFAQFANMFYWKTKNESARTPELKEVREQVIRAWQLQEARKRARKEAETLSEKINGKSDKEALAFLDGVLSSHPEWGKLITLDKVARQIELPAQPQKNVVYDKYKIDEDLVPYPTPTFVDDLLKLDQAQSSVLKDRPEKHFYVAYVVKRMPEPSLAEALVPENRANLWGSLSSDQKKQRIQALILDLRRQAARQGELDARGRFRLEPGITTDETVVE